MSLITPCSLTASFIDWSVVEPSALVRKKREAPAAIIPPTAPSLKAPVKVFVEAVAATVAPVSLPICPVRNSMLDP